MYSEDGNEMNNNLKEMLKILSEKLRYYAKQGIKLEDEVMVAYEKFEKIIPNENDTVVKALPFVFRFIQRNPKSNKKLLKLTRIESRKYFLDKDEKVIEAKKLVDQFFRIEE